MNQIKKESVILTSLLVIITTLAIFVTISQIIALSNKRPTESVSVKPIITDIPITQTIRINTEPTNTIMLEPTTIITQPICPQGFVQMCENGICKCLEQ